MNTDMNRIIQVLATMRQDARMLAENFSEAGYKALSEKYDIIFAGKTYSTINTVELVHSLKTKYDMDIDLKTLNSAVPAVCKTINAQYEPLYDVSKLQNAAQPSPHSFSITL